ncbi:hypothetical protein E3N88_04457 [Mikania micrantha]|uniref:Uncharacterized protein n=1 Tax=Mikania micrantha TaxID=192012 RepID=A0A5N6PUG0_9ASTR|nr:hypothetical protein E3N88_04457 [Mikania micrantha]
MMKILKLVTACTSSGACVNTRVACLGASFTGNLVVQTSSRSSCCVLPLVIEDWSVEGWKEAVMIGQSFGQVAGFWVENKRARIYVSDLVAGCGEKVKRSILDHHN